VLGALDDKIELNRRMNATLEAMARALFQSWFVDFDPVRAKLDGRPPPPSPPPRSSPRTGKTPRSVTFRKVGEIRSLDKTANYLNGLALPEVSARRRPHAPGHQDLPNSAKATPSEPTAATSTCRRTTSSKTATALFFDGPAASK